MYISCIQQMVIPMVSTTQTKGGGGSLARLNGLVDGKKKEVGQSKVTFCIELPSLGHEHGGDEEGLSGGGGGGRGAIGSGRPGALPGLVPTTRPGSA